MYFDLGPLTFSCNCKTSKSSCRVYKCHCLTGASPATLTINFRTLIRINFNNFMHAAGMLFLYLYIQYQLGTYKQNRGISHKRMIMVHFLNVLFPLLFVDSHDVHSPLGTFHFFCVSFFSCQLRSIHQALLHQLKDIQDIFYKLNFQYIFHIHSQLYL